MRHVVPVLAVLLLPVSLLTEAPGAACPPRACVLIIDATGEPLAALPSRQAAPAAPLAERAEAERPDRSAGGGGSDSGPPADAPAPDDRN